MNRLMHQLPRWPYLCLLAVLMAVMAGVLVKTHIERVALTAKFSVADVR